MAVCVVVAGSPPGEAEEFTTIRPAGFEQAPPTVRAVLALPTAALRGRWDAQGAPMVVVVPDHLGLDERAEFHTAALLAAGIAVLRLDIPPAADMGARSGPLPREPRVNPADDLLPAVFGVLRALDAERPSNRRAVGLLGFGAGGQAAVIAAHDDVVRLFLPGPSAPRFRAHAALYPTCYGRLLRRLRNAGAPTTGTPVLVVLPQDGGPGDDLGGCGVLFDRTDPNAPDPFTIRAYPWTRYGFDLSSAVAAIAVGRLRSLPGAVEPAPLDAAAAELARRDVAAVLVPALVPAPPP